MRILDAETQRSLHDLQLYLTPAEATEFKDALQELLRNPEAIEHRHVLGDGREISFSLITPAKLSDLRGYTDVERRVLQER